MPLHLGIAVLVRGRIEIVIERCLRRLQARGGKPVL